MKSRLEPLNCSSRRESALIVLQFQVERIHVRCYQVHGEGGRRPGEGGVRKFLLAITLMPSCSSADDTHPLTAVDEIHNYIRLSAAYSCPNDVSERRPPTES